MTDTSDELDQIGKNKKRPGRKPKEWMPYAEARNLVQSEMIPSRRKYDEWWNANKPKRLSRYPDRVYPTEWTSWNDFLGVDNKFSTVPKKFRPYAEAMAWAHKQSPKTYEQWMQFVKQPGNLPDDIPARPDLSYSTWKSWKHFLGNQPQAAIEAKQEIERTAIFYIVQYSDVPSNVFAFKLERGGISAIADRQKTEKFHVVSKFWYERERSAAVKQIVDMMSSPYYGDETQRICHNVFDIIWQIQVQLETVLDR